MTTMRIRRPHSLKYVAFFAIGSLMSLAGGAMGCGGADPPGTTGGGTLGAGAAGGGTGTGGASSAGGSAAAVCGNGLLEGAEECDDGNPDDTDGCTKECLLVRCGDGVVQGAEACDDGNFEDTDACVTGCVAASCGDGLVEKGIEDCDDGNFVDGDGCSAGCKAESVGCGNGKVDGAEECDDGNASNADGCLTTCVKAICGDGYARLGVEECDDGNANNDDFCTNDCMLNQPPTFGCPGAALNVGKGVDVGVTGDTSKSQDLDFGSCGGGASPEVVYAVTPDATGQLTVSIQGVGGTDPVLYVRSGDCAAGAELACADSTAAGGTETVTFAVTAGTTYWVFADGVVGAAGGYSMTLHLSTGVAGDTCPGVSVPIALGQEIFLDGDTSLAQADIKGTGACGLSGTKDLVYYVQPKSPGTLYVSVDPSPGFDPQVYVRAGTCTKPADQIVCEDTGGAGASELVMFPVVVGTKYFVVVDGKVGSAGAFVLDVLLDP